MKSLGECSSSLSIFEFLGQLSILLTFSGSFAVKNDNIRIFFAVVVANFEFAGCSKIKIRDPYCKTRPRMNQSQSSDFPETTIRVKTLRDTCQILGEK